MDSCTEKALLLGSEGLSSGFTTDLFFGPSVDLTLYMSPFLFLSLLFFFKKMVANCFNI